MRERALGEAWGEVDLVRQRIGDARFQALELLRLGEGFAMRILDEEIVECPAHARGVDARVDDVAAREVNPARDAIEQAGMVGGDHRDQRRAARLVIFAVDRQLVLLLARGGVMHEIERDDVGRLGDPVGIAHRRGEFFDKRRFLVQHVGHFGLLVRDLLFAPVPHVPKPQAFARDIVEFAQQLAFPAVPRAGADRADIDCGEDGEMAQPFLALHLADEILDRLGVGQIAFLRDMAHQQVVEHQPGDHFGLALAEPEARTQLFRHFGPKHRVIAAAALGDIVQQGRDIGRAARTDLVDQPRGARVVVGQFALLDLVEQADRADGVLVHRIMVVHVELHLRVDLAEIGHELPEHARLVHPAQHHFGVVAPAQQIEKQRIGALVFADGIIDQSAVAIRLPHRLGVDLELFGFGQLEYLDQPHRVLLEPVVRGRGDAPAKHAVALQLARLLLPSREETAARGLGLELLVDMREEDAGQRSDPLGLQEVVLHEPLDRALARTLGEIHPLGDPALEIEGQPVLGATREHMHVAAHREQEVFRAAEAAVFGLREQPDIDQFGSGPHAVDELADPVERVQVAQSALAVLHIGFDDIAAVAHALVPRIAFGQFLADEIAFVAANDLGRIAPRAFIVELLIAPYVTPFEQGCADRQIGLRQPHGFVERAGRMAHLEAEIPQQIQHRLDYLLAPGGLLAADEEGDVDIRMRRHLGAAVSAHRHDREALRLRPVGAGVEMRDRVIVDDPDQLVDQEREAPRIFMPGRRLGLEPLRQLGAALVERILEQADDMRARLVAVLPDQRIDSGGKLAPVDDRALAGDGCGAQAARCSLAKVAFTVRLSTFCVPRRGSCSSLCHMTEGTLNAAICSRRNSCSSSTDRLCPGCGK